MARTAIMNDIKVLRGGAAPKDIHLPIVHPVKETKFSAFTPADTTGYVAASSRPPDTVAIVIDNGSSAVRGGWSFESSPCLSVPPITAKYRERKLGRTFSFAGMDCYADTTARGHIRNAFEQGTGIVSNWDVMEHVLDYIFIKMGMNDRPGELEGSIDMPIVMTEAVANLAYSRKCEFGFPAPPPMSSIMLMKRDPDPHRHHLLLHHHQYSHDGNHVRMLPRPVGGIWHRFALFLSPQ